jgi:hypothetical protein
MKLIILILIVIHCMTLFSQNVDLDDIRIKNAVIIKMKENVKEKVLNLTLPSRVYTLDLIFNNKSEAFAEYPFDYWEVKCKLSLIISQDQNDSIRGTMLNVIKGYLTDTLKYRNPYMEYKNQLVMYYDEVTRQYNIGTRANYFKDPLRETDIQYHYNLIKIDDLWIPYIYFIYSPYEGKLQFTYKSKVYTIQVKEGDSVGLVPAMVPALIVDNLLLIKKDSFYSKFNLASGLENLQQFNKDILKLQLK